MSWCPEPRKQNGEEVHPYPTMRTEREKERERGKEKKRKNERDCRAWWWQSCRCRIFTGELFLNLLLNLICLVQQLRLDCLQGVAPATFFSVLLSLSFLSQLLPLSLKPAMFVPTQHLLRLDWLQWGLDALSIPSIPVLSLSFEFSHILLSLLPSFLFLFLNLFLCRTCNVCSHTTSSETWLTAIIWCSYNKKK